MKRSNKKVINYLKEMSRLLKLKVKDIKEKEYVERLKDVVIDQLSKPYEMQQDVNRMIEKGRIK